MESTFNLTRLLQDVFAPDESDTALVMHDVPTEANPDQESWSERRVMAREWHDGLREMGVKVLPILSYEATGGGNADLPATGLQDGRTVSIEEVLSRTTLVLSMTRFSATAPLSMYTRKFPRLRAASMPGVLKRMEQTALAADYLEVARKASILADALETAETANITFSTGHEVLFDLRFRSAHADDGMCRRDKQGFRLINLPSGEAFIVPYEGEHDNEPSRTAGVIPLMYKRHLYTFSVCRNRIDAVHGDGPERAWLEDHFGIDEARRNIAELGLGCNNRAVITGNVLEDEKAGFHWAYGRSEHLGGTVGPDRFTSPDHVIHHDIVYARGCPIEISLLELTDASGKTRTVIRDGDYADIF